MDVGRGAIFGGVKNARTRVLLKPGFDKGCIILLMIIIRK